MVNQKPISARIDNTILWNIDQEVMLGTITRNRILNEGAQLWLELVDARREYRMMRDSDARRKILVGFLKKHFPEMELYKYETTITINSINVYT